MSTHSLLIVDSDGQTTTKIARISISPRGDIFVSAPYHSSNTGTITKLIAPMEGGVNTIARDKFKRQVVTNLSGRSVKLSHHVSGFAQVSGAGIVSGLINNQPKGMGLWSSSLNDNGGYWPNDGGPIFTMTLWGLNDFQKINTTPQDTLRIQDFLDTTISPGRHGVDAIFISGFYRFPKYFNKFGLDPSSCKYVPIEYPDGQLPMAFVVQSPYINGLGRLCLVAQKGLADFKDAPSGFLIGGAPGKLEDINGVLHSEAIFLSFPKDPSFPAIIPSLDFT